jgi:protocatechuate 3,4-dioxygenase beta subunit
MEHLTRRKALGTLGAVSVGALLAACGVSDDPVTSTSVTTSDGATATVQPQSGPGTSVDDLFAESASCTLTPEETEGPYYFDVDSVRSDIREDRDGTDLRVAIRVQDAAACTPIANAVVDIWHCDAEGVYSGFESASTGGPGGSGPTDDDTFLRGVQVTNAKGIVEFLTIYPGWYRGRTVHIHAKVHIDRATALTTQMYFDEDVTDAVYANDPYAEHAGRDTFNDSDGIFDAGLVMTLAHDEDGYLGVMTFGVDAS